ITMSPEPALAEGGCLLDLEELGGIPWSHVVSGNSLYIAVVSGFAEGSAVGALREYDLTSNTLLPDSITPVDQSPFELALCPTGELVLGDAKGGFRVYGADGEELTTGLLDLGLPPTAAVNRTAVCYTR